MCMQQKDTYDANAYCNDVAGYNSFLQRGTQVYLGSIMLKVATTYKQAEDETHRVITQHYGCCTEFLE